MSQVIDKINAEQIEGRDVPEFGVGDTVKVHVRIREGEKERIQNFTGTVIARDGAGNNETFTVRRVSHGVGVERVFPVYSPHLAEIEIERKGKVKRAKLYFLRNLTGRKARMKIRSAR
ncbi:MAG: 50S ribosomal protein L19 [Kiritimatiellia bacterium]|nr:50S ribosomal protein L19 [Kiritimatiellia bacterium]MDP6631563.1 50S ribosomal protein L19 [Kiritimatiellia bacterium]MDP6810669.1 50S ribosomal protein L19 [Kiritimatiellia bacterium]MDP7023755.1 50S ribosomal protein L19 [Kiritimatiellia bacterium]